MCYLICLSNPNLLAYMCLGTCSNIPFPVHRKAELTKAILVKKIRNQAVGNYSHKHAPAENSHINQGQGALLAQNLAASHDIRALCPWRNNPQVSCKDRQRKDCHRANTIGYGTCVGEIVVWSWRTARVDDADSLWAEGLDAVEMALAAGAAAGVGKANSITGRSLATEAFSAGIISTWISSVIPLRREALAGVGAADDGGGGGNGSGGCDPDCRRRSRGHTSCDSPAAAGRGVGGRIGADRGHVGGDSGDGRDVAAADDDGSPGCGGCDSYR
jgi:hypothetical protein